MDQLHSFFLLIPNLNQIIIFDFVILACILKPFPMIQTKARWMIQNCSEWLLSELNQIELMTENETENVHSD